MRTRIAKIPVNPFKYASRVFFLIPILSSVLNAQSIPSTNGTNNCFSCAPTGWTVVFGTPDISNRNIAATTETTGGGTSWDTAPLPLPPNNHTNWISLRDLGSAGDEEIVETIMTGLTPGAIYELTIYTLTATGPYSEEFNNSFRYQINGNGLQTITGITQNSWGTEIITFTASNNQETIQFLPGNDSGGFGSFESVQISVAQDAILPIDTDNDGVPDFEDICNGFDDTIDTDGDMVPDGCDQDDDNDGILDVEECPYSILWVTEGGTTTAQQNTINKLQALGHTVMVVDDDDSNDANNFDVVFVFEDSFSSNVLANIENLTNTANGVVTSETALHDDLLGSDPGSEIATSFVEIVNNAHFITSDLAQGNLNVGNGNNKASAILNSGTVLGNHSDGEASLVVWNRGDNLDNGVAPGRRAIVPFGNDAGIEYNSQGEDLLVNVILWAAEGSDFSLCDTDNDTIKDSLDNDSDADDCFDALEGSAIFSTSDIDGNGRLVGGVDLITGIPIIAVSGQNDVSAKDDTVVADACLTDSDGDSVTDSNDECPDTPPGEDVNADGCSASQLDDDNDGVTNDIDLCPDTPEAEGVNADGCADSQLDDDNDGVTNDIDLCPDTPQGETVDADGCSGSQLDDDNDGVTNDIDLCPNTPEGESVNADGCSDSQLDDDNDGVTNDIDLCPDTPEAEGVDADGCSDSQLDDDNDGVTNDIDLCPSTPEGESVDADGCSDSQLDDDNDGVANDTDLCPNTPEGASVDADGCADFENPDSDGDGVTDIDELNDGTDIDNPCDFLVSSVTKDQSGAYLSADCDGDGAVNGDEQNDGTDPNDPCDFVVSSITQTRAGAYLLADCDGDGVTNGNELRDRTSPVDPCDLDISSITVQQSGLFLTEDCDGDTIDNGRELIDGTDPFNPCSSIGGTPPSGAVCDVEIEHDMVGPGQGEQVFRINNIESFPNNTVEIYNRWGVKVFETRGYDNINNVFRGISNGRATIQKNEELPAGVYYYILNYENNGENITRSGYLYVNR